MPPPFDLLPILLDGFDVTIRLTLIGAFFALIIAIIAGILRASRNRLLRWIVSIYVETFRGTSVLVQMFWIWAVLPLEPFRINISAFTAGVIALSLNIGAYGAEVVRGAIAAVPRGQTEAGIALNFSRLQRMRHIVLPQAMVRIIPPFGNLLIELMKATSLVSLITVADITFQALTLRQTTGGRTIEIFSLLLLIYFAIAYPLTLGVRWYERRRKWA